MSILDQLAEYARKRVEEEQKQISFNQMKETALALDKKNFSFEKALAKPGLSVIAECKKASPSKGLIAAEFDPAVLAKEYEAAGAECISVLTEPKWFLGSDHYLQQVKQVSSLPVLRKDFIVDPYQIYQARVLNADAILLICALLSQTQLEDYLQIAQDLGLSVLVEAHDEKEIEMALKAGARIIGVNNRNLKDFSVDMHNSQKLRDLVKDKALFISESGVSSPEDLEILSKMKADGVLIGESLMRAKDKKEQLNWLKSTL